ncbi:NADAR family protein [Hoeflea olei]|uniref:NADAR family protein n=1 Tax=Hoeflea olei TaxID=1480615 RepID=UPI000826E3F6|nr:NADAR family protein [Hoeflea olei]
MSQAEFREYERDQVVSFRKTTEDFGGLSNMAPGYPIYILGLRVRTSEALYQACRFPHLPQVQRMIVEETSPMTAKMRSKPYRDDSRADWEEVRVKVMRWCLRAKLLHNWPAFSKLLLATGDRPIVEDSRKDDYWGAKGGEDNLLAGRNVLGRLLMELREIVRSDPARLEELYPLDIPNFLLLGDTIPMLTRRGQHHSERGIHDVNPERTKSVATKAVDEPVQDRLL